MKLVQRIHIPLRRRELDPARTAFREYCIRHGVVFAEGVEGIAELEMSDPRRQELIDLLARYGLVLRPQHVVAMQDDDWLRFVLHDTVRIYDADDLGTCEWLIFSANTKACYDETHRSDAGILEIHGQRAARWMQSADFSSREQGDGLLASDRARRAIKSAALSGPRFDTVLVGQSSSLSAHPQWWELDSDVQLPPVSDTMYLVNAREQPIRPGDTSGGAMMVRPRDGVRPAEIYYRRTAISSVGPFDMARMFEPFGPSNRKRNGVVVSQKFYQTCRDNDLKASWTPVRIDEG